MFCCCDSPPCEHFADDFSNDRRDANYEGGAPAAVVDTTNGFMEPNGTVTILPAVLPGVATVIFVAEVLAPPGGTFTMEVAGDGSGFIKATVTNTGDCGEVVLQSEMETSRTIYDGATSGTTYGKFFLFYSNGWLRFGRYGGGAIPTATTINAIQSAATGFAVRFSGTSGVRFNRVAVADNEPCYSLVTPCGYGPELPNITWGTTWTNDAGSMPCPYLETLGSWQRLQVSATILIGFPMALFQSPTSGRVDLGHPNYFNSDKGVGWANFQIAAGNDTGLGFPAAGSGTIKVYLGNDYVTLNAPSTGLWSLSLNGGQALQLAAMRGQFLGLALSNDGDLLVGYLRQLDESGITIKRKVSSRTINGVADRVSVETSGVSGGFAVMVPSLYGLLIEPSPPEAASCRVALEQEICTACNDGNTISTITVTINGGLTEPANPGPCPPDDGGSCGLLSTITFSVNDINEPTTFAAGFGNPGGRICTWSKNNIPLSYVNLPGGTCVPRAITSSYANATVTIHQTAGDPNVYLTFSVAIFLFGPTLPGGQSGGAFTWRAIVSDPFNDCVGGSSFTLPNVSASHYGFYPITPSPQKMYVCENFNTTVDVEFS